MIFRSPHPAIDLPDTPITPLVLRHADRLADKPALIDGSTGRATTYGQLRHAVERASAGLHDQGVRQGAVVAIYAPNSIDYVVAFHAIASLGAIASTVNPLYVVDELALQLRQHGARFLITTDSLLERAEEAVASTA
ncbi:MAG: AMP-binding protein, partial [Thermomicrobiales bacterium]|nr:AMP-binding protein [Thermomicrobiales bacterium]